MSRSILAACHLGRGFVALAIASHLALSQQAAASRAATTGLLDGIVTDTSLAPLADATVSIVGSGIQVVTGANGRFQISGLPAGRTYLLLRRIGFEPSSPAITVAGGDTLRASFALLPIRTLLDTVVVAGKRLSPKMQEFEERRKFGEGRFMTAGAIDTLNLVSTDDLFRHLISNHVRPVPSLHASQSCARAQWFLDGVILPPPPYYSERDLPSPKELAGIEYYSSPTNIPVQFRTTSSGGLCGVILMWTKDGSARP